DGRRTTFEPLDEAGWQQRAARPGLEGNVYRQVPRLVREQADEIQRRFPKILRRVSGYNLAEMMPLTGAPGKAGLHQLVVGGEGTLAVIGRAEGNLVPPPRFPGLLRPEFETLGNAMDAVAACLELRPSAVELMDHFLLELTAGNLSLRETMKPIRGKPGALFMVEFSSDDQAEVADRVEKLQRRLQGVN